MKVGRAPAPLLLFELGPVRIISSLFEQMVVRPVELTRIGSGFNHGRSAAMAGE
jgi:hypothetical protein